MRSVCVPGPAGHPDALHSWDCSCTPRACLSLTRGLELLPQPALFPPVRDGDDGTQQSFADGVPAARHAGQEEDVFLDHIREGLARSKGRGENYHCPSWDQLAIDETGQLLLCCGMTSHDSDHVLGNILEMSAEEIWETKPSDAFCRECISSGLARWLSESDFHSMPLPQREYSHSIAEPG